MSCALPTAASPHHHFFLALRDVLFPPECLLLSREKAPWKVPDKVAHTVIPAIRRQRQECDHGFEASLGYSVNSNSVPLTSVSKHFQFNAPALLFHLEITSFSTSCSQDATISPCCQREGDSVRHCLCLPVLKLQCVNSLDNIIIRSSPFPQARCLLVPHLSERLQIHSVSFNHGPLCLATNIGQRVRCSCCVFDHFPEAGFPLLGTAIILLCQYVHLPFPSLLYASKVILGCSLLATWDSVFCRSPL